MTSQFQRNLDRMAAEIRDLKTAHNRGLDTTRFYKYTLSIPTQPMTDYDFTAKIADGEPQNPIIIPAMQAGEPISGASIYAYRYSATETRLSVFTPWDVGGTITVAVISSSRLKEFAQI